MEEYKKIKRRFLLFLQITSHFIPFFKTKSQFGKSVNRMYFFVVISLNINHLIYFKRIDYIQLAFYKQIMLHIFGIKNPGVRT